MTGEPSKLALALDEFEGEVKVFYERWGAIHQWLAGKEGKAIEA